MTDKNSPKPPKKSKKSPKKKKAQVKKLVTENKEELNTLKQILKNSHQQDAIGHAVGIMQENLNSYILLGYSFGGDPITAVAARTPQEYDALYSRAVQFVQQNSSPSQPPCGDDSNSE